MKKERELLRECRYREYLRAALEENCEVYPTAAQLDGLLNGLAGKGFSLASGKPYFDAEAYVLKAAFGCVEDAIRRAQASAMQRADAEV